MASGYRLRRNKKWRQYHVTFAAGLYQWIQAAILPFAIRAE
jgi:hypothetical protein